LFKKPIALFLQTEAAVYRIKDTGDVILILHLPGIGVRESTASLKPLLLVYDTAAETSLVASPIQTATLSPVDVHRAFIPSCFRVDVPPEIGLRNTLIRSARQGQRSVLDQASIADRIEAGVELLAPIESSINRYHQQVQHPLSHRYIASHGVSGFQNINPL